MLFTNCHTSVIAGFHCLLLCSDLLHCSRFVHTDVCMTCIGTHDELSNLYACTAKHNVLAVIPGENQQQQALSLARMGQHSAQRRLSAGACEPPPWLLKAPECLHGNKAQTMQCIHNRHIAESAAVHTAAMQHASRTAKRLPLQVLCLLA